MRPLDDSTAGGDIATGQTEPQCRQLWSDGSTCGADVQPLVHDHASTSTLALGKVFLGSGWGADTIEQCTGNCPQHYTP